MANTKKPKFTELPPPLLDMVNKFLVTNGFPNAAKQMLRETKRAAVAAQGGKKQKGKGKSKGVEVFWQNAADKSLPGIVALYEQYADKEGAAATATASKKKKAEDPKKNVLLSDDSSSDSDSDSESESDSDSDVEMEDAKPSAKAAKALAAKPEDDSDSSDSSSDSDSDSEDEKPAKKTAKPAPTPAAAPAANPLKRKAEESNSEESSSELASYVHPPLVAKISRHKHCEDLEHEMYYYEELETLQGVVLPRCYGLFQTRVRHGLSVIPPDSEELAGKGSRDSEDADGEFVPAVAEPAPKTISGIVSVILLERLGGHLPVGKPLPAGT